MTNLSDLGRLLIVVGGVLMLLGLVLLLSGRVPFLGRMPGDINIRRGNITLYFPVVTCLMLSIILTVVVNLILVLLRRR